MRDRAMQALHRLTLDPAAEVTGDGHSYGFRRERSTADAIAQVRNVPGRDASPKWVLEGDIKGCFDNISPDRLLANVCMDKGVLRKWLRVGFLEGGVLFPTRAGIPQGGMISPVLANLALDGLQHALDELFDKARRAREAKVHRVRYADDFVITGSARALLEARVPPLVAQFLATRGLALSESKTVITHVADGFDFLGWTVRRFHGMRVIQPSKTYRTAFLRKVRGVLDAHRAASQATVMDALVPLVRGWAN